MLRQCSILAAALVLSVAGPAGSQTESNNLWLMWEHIPPADPLCLGEAACGPVSELRSHFMMNVPTRDAADLFQRLAPSAAHFGSANLSHEALPICLDGPEPRQPPDLAGLAYADKTDTLRGLPGVFADLRGVRGPAAYRGQFGEDAHAYLVAALTAAGIRLLSREEMEATPGRPTLAMRFLPEVHGCRPWSVSLSLSQDLLLARDLTMMISGTTWSASQSQSETDADFAPDDAMQAAILSFVQAWQDAHAPDIPAPSDVLAEAPPEN